MGKYKEISTLEEFKEILKEKRNFWII
jgi:hypothetical protein